jgi:hypothetical protein
MLGSNPQPGRPILGIYVPQWQGDKFLPPGTWYLKTDAQYYWYRFPWVRYVILNDMTPSCISSGIWRACGYCVGHRINVCVRLRFSPLCSMGVETANWTRAVPETLKLILSSLILIWYLQGPMLKTCGNCNYRWELLISQAWCVQVYENQFGLFRERTLRKCVCYDLERFRHIVPLRTRHHNNTYLPT